MRRFLIGWLCGSALAITVIMFWLTGTAIWSVRDFQGLTEEPLSVIDIATRMLANLPFLSLVTSTPLLVTLLTAAAISRVRPGLHYVAYTGAGVVALPLGLFVWTFELEGMPVILLIGALVGALSGFLAGWISRSRGVA